MHVELHCPACVNDYRRDLECSAWFEQLSEEGPWLALGDGTTIEDELHSRLQDDLECPSCGGPVDVQPTSLGRLSLQLLTQW